MNRRFAILVAGSMLALLVLGPDSLMSRGVGDNQAAAADEQPAARVSLLIDYGDGAQKVFTRLPHKDGMTVLDVMEAAKAHKHGITFEFRGQGEGALLTRIDDLTNQGRGRNWLYRVNDKPGDRSFAVFPVKAGERVEWRFDVYR